MARLRYITDKNGTKTDVVLPLLEYERLLAAAKKQRVPLTPAQVRAKNELKAQFQESFQELADIQAGKRPKPTTTLDDLIQELEATL